MANTEKSPKFANFSGHSCTEVAKVSRDEKKKLDDDVTWVTSKKGKKKEVILGPDIFFHLRS